MFLRLRGSMWLLLLLVAACNGSGQQPAATEPRAEGVVAATAGPRATVQIEPPPSLTPIATSPVAEPTTLATETATLLPATATATVEPSPSPLPAPIQVTTITLAPVATGLDRPVYLTHAGDQRLFVVEQAGRVRIIKDGELLNLPFLDIGSQVGFQDQEQGFLNLAFHPDYNRPESPGWGRFFVYYTDRQGNAVLSSFRVSSSDPDVADSSSEQNLLILGQPYRNHNGGQLQFGPDGYLYLSTGDGGSAGDPDGNGQNPATLLGAVLRLDVESEEEYAIPATNPFVGVTGARPEIWAWGLRHPWRFSFDRSTGDMYLSDVGENQWEEVNFQPADSPGGENYGWNRMEASHCYPAEGTCDLTGLTLPIFEYDHSQGCAINGGYVYRGQQFPELSGNYFAGDFCTGRIWSLVPLGNGTWSAIAVRDRTNPISSFGEDAAGELYVLDYSDGTVRQIQP